MTLAPDTAVLQAELRLLERSAGASFLFPRASQARERMRGKLDLFSPPSAYWLSDSSSPLSRSTCGSIWIKSLAQMGRARRLSDCTSYPAIAIPLTLPAPARQH